MAIVSQNSARLLAGFYGVSAWGRVYVPINFRLARDEIAYIVEHCGATVLLVDPELVDVVEGIECEHTFVLGRDDDQIYLEGVEPEPWEPDEDATATINYTSGTTARPKGVQMTHRNLWVNAATFGWHTGVSDRDVYLHTLPMFHCNGWGMPYAVTGMGVRHVVLRKVDGVEILQRVEAEGVTLLCGAPAVVAMILEAAATWDGPDPRGRPHPHRRGRRAAAHRAPSSGSRPSSAGSSSRSTASPRRRRCSPSTAAVRSGTTSRPASGPACCRGPACPRSASP